MANSLSNRLDRVVGILIVEDDPLRASGLASFLKEMGFSVAGVISSEAEAGAMVNAQRPELALVNPSLSRPTDGLAVARTLEQVYRLPCVFMVEADDHALRERAASSHPWASLDIPLRPSQVLWAVEDALNRQRELQYAA